MLPLKILKLRSSVETCILQVVFASLESSRRATKLHEKGHFAQDFNKWGACAPCAPGSYIHDYIAILDRNFFQINYANIRKPEK